MTKIVDLDALADGPSARGKEAQAAVRVIIRGFEKQNTRFLYALASSMVTVRKAMTQDD